MSKKGQNPTDYKLLRSKAEEKLKKQSPKAVTKVWNPTQESSSMNFRYTR